MFGSVTRQNICQPLAPRLTAAISSSGPTASITGISSRATNGKVTKVVARIRPGVAKMMSESGVGPQKKMQSPSAARSGQRGDGKDQAEAVVAPAQQHRARGEGDGDERARRRRRPLAVFAQEDAEVALQTEQQHEDQAGHDRRHRERQVDQRQQQRPAGEAEAGDRPRRPPRRRPRSARTAVGATVRVSRIAERVSRSPTQRLEVRADTPLPKRLDEHVHHRHDDQHDRSRPAPPRSGRSHPQRVLAALAESPRVRRGRRPRGTRCRTRADSARFRRRTSQTP